MTKKSSKTTATETDEPTESISYADAMSELESIVAELEGEEPDIDQLADKVERAGFLILQCRERLGATKSRLEEITANIDGS